MVASRKRISAKNLVFCCNSVNDLYVTLCRQTRIKFPRFDAPADAIRAGREGASVLILADEYPAATDIIDAPLLGAAKRKKLRLYVEYPAAVEGVELGTPQPTVWERVVVSSNFFGAKLPNQTVLAQHGCWFLPAKCGKPHMVVARVAGYRTAAYGLPKETSPILFQLPRTQVMLATSKLSHFITGRYGPAADWAMLWRKLLSWLSGADLPELSWSPTVGMQAQAGDRLPGSIELDAFTSNVKWFDSYVIHNSPVGGIAALEGYEAAIDHSGRQRIRNIFRGDCTGETAMVFALDYALSRDPSSKLKAQELLDFVWSDKAFRHGDPNDPAYGLNDWFMKDGVFYGDDNARVVMPALLSARLLGDERWDAFILRNLLANLRTTGPTGFRDGRVEQKEFQPGPDGWRFMFDREIIHYAPHYQGYLWAAFLWAYGLTGYRPFRDRTLTAIRMTMEKYPRWEWTNGLAQEIARMMLPLAMLVRVEDTLEHRAWLKQMTDDLLALQQPCGAIRELLGTPGEGRYPPPKSNDEYGKYEAPLIQENGQPSCDLLYTTNYAYLGLHEAAAATGDASLKVAADRLTEFLSRIQVKSRAHPYLDGAWMRGFDYELWEYFGSSADIGWGAWCLESGWTNAWIAAILAMRKLGITLFDLSLSERFKKLLPDMLKEMGLER